MLFSEEYFFAKQRHILKYVIYYYHIIELSRKLDLVYILYDNGTYQDKKVCIYIFF